MGSNQTSTITTGGTGEGVTITMENGSNNGTVRSRRRRVVSLDDCTEILTVMRLCLDEDWYEVWPCDDEAEAMCLLCFGREIDVFTQDLDRPGGIGGVEFLQLMKGHPTLRRIPVLIISGHPVSTVREMLWRRGVQEDDKVGFLQKPFTADALASSIEMLACEDR
jgi:DNA-binding NtrC family response regulator